MKQEFLTYWWVLLPVLTLTSILLVKNWGTISTKNLKFSWLRYVLYAGSVLVVIIIIYNVFPLGNNATSLTDIRHWLYKNITRPLFDASPLWYYIIFFAVIFGLFLKKFLYLSLLIIVAVIAIIFWGPLTGAKEEIHNSAKWSSSEKYDEKPYFSDSIILAPGGTYSFIAKGKDDVVIIKPDDSVKDIQPTLMTYYAFKIDNAMRNYGYEGMQVISDINQAFLQGVHTRLVSLSPKKQHVYIQFFRKK